MGAAGCPGIPGRILSVWVAGSPRNTQRFKETVQLFFGRTLPFDLGAALVFGGIISDARRKGLAIGFQDGLIAAVATYRKCAVATRDVGPFEAAGVEVINPWKADPDTGTMP